MPSHRESNSPITPHTRPTEDGWDMSKFPIDNVLRQAISPDKERFYSGCSLLKLMCSVGRVEAGVFLLGLLKFYSEDYGRLTQIADALQFFPTKETVDALASELRRVKGSSSTRAYLRKIIHTLKCLPEELAMEEIEKLSSDPLVGPRFRQHLRAISEGHHLPW
jgi:hypothetical protein